MIDFFCPTCGNETRTLESRPIEGQRRRRRKVCLANPTHQRLTTVEITQEEYDLLLAYKELLLPNIQNFTKATDVRIFEQSNQHLSRV